MIVIGSPSANVSMSLRGRHEELGYSMIEGTFCVPSLRGSFSTLWMQPKQFVAELEEMDRTLIGEAAFAGIDQEVEIRLKMHTLGAVEVNGRFSDHQNYEASVNFGMDQTYLGPLVRALRAELGAAQ